MTVTLAGIIPPLCTPTDDQDRVDEPALRRSVQRLLEAGVHGLFVGGTAGEGPLLTEREWTRLMEIVADETRGRLPLLGGVQDTSTAKVVDKVRRLRPLGYGFFVVTPTFYIPSTTVDEQLRLFAACRDAAGPMEMIAYNIPQVTGSKLPIETFRELGRRGWIRYCKESSGDLPFVQRLLAESRELNLQVLMGDERSAGAALLAGAVGLVNLCANLEPATYLSLYEAARRRDEVEVGRCQERINRIVDEVVLSGPCWLSGPKYVLARQGLGRPSPVSPLGPVPPEQARRIDAFLAQT